MKTCPVCSERYEDGVSVCPTDGEPLDAVTVAAAKAAEVRDDETVLRPKRARPLSSPRFTEVRLERPEPQAPPPVDPVRRTEVPDRIVRETSHWPAILGLGVILAGALAVIAWLALSGQADLAKEVGAEITEARVAVAEARARLEALPQESPLRARVLTLQQWDRELQQLELGERTNAVASRARTIASEARAIGDAARAAGATGAATPANSNATPLPGSLPETPPPGDPLAPPPDGAPVDPVEPPMPAAPPPQTLPPGTPPDAKTPPPTNSSNKPSKKGDDPPSKAEPPPPPPPETPAVKPGR